MKDWMNAIEAAALVGVNKHTIMRACRAKKLESYKQGNTWQISRSALEAWWGRPLSSPIRDVPTHLPVVTRPLEGEKPDILNTGPLYSLPLGIINFLSRHGVSVDMARAWPTIPESPTQAMRFAHARGIFRECQHPDCACHKYLHKKPPGG